MVIKDGNEPRDDEDHMAEMVELNRRPTEKWEVM